jgi:hypothetical protein
MQRNYTVQKNSRRFFGNLQKIRKKILGIKFRIKFRKVQSVINPKRLPNDASLDNQ